MITKNFRSFILWIAGVACAASAIAYVVPSSPMHPANAPITHVVGRGAHAVAASPALNAASSNGAAASPVTNVVVEESLNYPKLKALLETNPAAVKGFVFESNTLDVAVKRASGSTVVITLPDSDAKVELRKRAEDLKIDYDVKTAPPVAAPAASSSGSGGWIQMGLILLGVSIVSVFLQRWLMGRMGAAGGGVNAGFAKSKAKDVKKLGERADKVMFSDIAGCDEAVVELRRIVQTVMDAGIYGDFDGEVPRGVLLLGPPGTGKTLCAKAMANESNGTMKALAGSDFVEMFVGVGAGRIRDEFALARKTVDETGKPYFIFIDEFDAVGGKRGNGANGNNSERENTLNQLLVEMDGMETNRGIVIVAATNRADMLDPALLRPGRFEAQVMFDLPDAHGREKIFAIHTRKKKLADNVSHAVLANRTYGYSGAEIKGACNRAAIVAAERWLAKSALMKAAGSTDEEIKATLPKIIELSDFDEGIDFIRLGAAKTGSQSRMAEKDKKNTIYHEGGHALVSVALGEDADPVVKITAMRRNRALGYVQYMPTGDRVSFTDRQAVARIICAMAGRAAQEVYLNTVDTGASNDFEQASNMARSMVTKWGMSRLGHISVGEAGPSIGSHGSGGHMSYGAALADEIDAEWRRIVEECYAIARYIVEAEKDRMEALVAELTTNETMLQPRWNAFLEEHKSAVDPSKVKFNPAAK